MITKKISASLEVKEVIRDKDKIAELDEARQEIQSSQSITITSDGNVGIGTKDPSVTLHVK